MIAKLTKDNQFLELVFNNENEKLCINDYFTKKVKNYIFLKKKNKHFNGIIKYIINGNLIKVTLWNDLILVCEKYGFELEFSNFDNYFRNNITFEYVRQFSYKLLEDCDDIVPRDEQIEAVYKAIKYRKSNLKIATSGGKTLIIYIYMMLLRYLEKDRRILIITPDPNLVGQNYAEFVEYASARYQLRMALVSGDSKDRKKLDSYNHVIGNFQTLINLPEDYLAKFNAVICDEVHRSVSSSIQKIIKMVGSTDDMMGCSGSIDEDEYADYMTIKNSFGPIVMSIDKRELIDKGSATDIVVKVLDIRFCSDADCLDLVNEKDYIEDPEKALRYEQQFIRNNRLLFEWKCQFLLSLEGNTIGYFWDKKSLYGKSIYDRINEINIKRGLNKRIYYIDGDVSFSDRDIMKEAIKDDDTGNSILIANYNTFSTGQSIKNLTNAVMLESLKSNILINQTSGRLLRLSNGKDCGFFYDIIENTNISRYNHTSGETENKRCFMFNWGKHRRKHYLLEKLKIEDYKLDITK